MSRLIRIYAVWHFSISTFHINFFPIDCSLKKKQTENVVWNLAPKELTMVTTFVTSCFVSFSSKSLWKRLPRNNQFWQRFGRDISLESVSVPLNIVIFTFIAVWTVGPYAITLPKSEVTPNVRTTNMNDFCIEKNVRACEPLKKKRKRDTG